MVGKIQLTLLGLFFPYLCYCLPTPQQNLGIIRGEDGRFYEALVLRELTEGDLDEILHPFPQEPEILDAYRSAYPVRSPLHAEPRRQTRAGKGLKTKKEGKKEYDEWILSNLG